MQQIYRKTPMSKCDFNKVVSDFIEIALRQGRSPVNLLHIFRTPFQQNMAASGKRSLIITCKEIFLSGKVLGLYPTFLLKKETLSQVFFPEFCVIFHESIFQNPLEFIASIIEEIRKKNKPYTNLYLFLKAALGHYSPDLKK